MGKETTEMRDVNTPEEIVFVKAQDEVLNKLHKVLEMAKFMNKLGKGIMQEMGSNFFDENGNFIMSDEGFEILYDNIAKKSLEHAFILGFEMFHHQMRNTKILDIMKVIEDKSFLKQIEFQFESLVKDNRESADESGVVTNNMDTFFYMKKNFFFDELNEEDDIKVFFTIGAMVWKMHQQYDDEELLKDQEPQTEEEKEYDVKARDLGKHINDQIHQIINDIDSFDNDDMLKDAFMKICDTNIHTFMLGITLIDFYTDKDSNHELFGAAFNPFQLMKISAKYNDLMKESYLKLPNKRMNSLLFIETLSSIIGDQVAEEDMIPLYACIAINYYQNTLGIADQIRQAKQG